MSVHSASKKGLRNQNEDKHSIIININGEDSTKQNINLYGVYDGHGGKFLSKYLEDNLPNKFLAKEITYPLSGRVINKIYKSLNEDLVKNHNRQANLCGSTCLVAIEYKYNGKRFIDILNTGDSRCVMCGEDNIAQVKTIDHKPNTPDERLRIQELGGEIYYDGYDWRIKDLSVSRAFGDLDASPFVVNKPDVYRFKVKRDDKFLVLACDGLWDVLSNQEVVDLVLNNYYDIKTGNKLNVKKNIAKILAETAIQKGSSDNVTVLVVFLN